MIEKTDDLQILWAKIKDIKVAMLVSVTAEGGYHSRPMMTAQKEFSGTLFFFARSTSPKVDEILEEPRVLLNYTEPDDSTFIAVYGKDNTTFEFDCGAAWMSLTMQARMMDLYTHGMVGFSRDKAAHLLRVNTENEKIIAAFAVGKKSDPSQLPGPLQEREKMNSRKDLHAIYELHE